jgi:sugar phosphate permease
MIAGAEVLDWSRDVQEVSLPIVGVVAPWQATFIAVGLPGVLIAGLLATIREPKRKGRQGALREVPGWRAVLNYMWQRKKVYAALHLGVPFIVVMLYGLQAWTPTILLRVYGWDLADAGRIYGTLALVTGSAGVLSGPVLSRYLLGRGVLDAPLRVAVLGAGMATLSLATLPFQSSGAMALVSIGCASFFVTLPLALITTVMQEVTPNNMRGVVNGMYVVTNNVLGLALGPTLVAASTDYVFQDTMAVAKSLALVAVFVGPIAVYLLNQGRRSYIELEDI